MIVEAFLLAVIGAATPLLIAALGELVVERSGVLNLGVEGMMIIGAVASFGVALSTGSPWLGMLAALGAGMAMATLFAVLTLVLATNQVATGLALTLFGLGLSGLLGEALVGQPGVRLRALELGPLADLPIIGTLVFGHNILVYLSLALAGGIWWVMFRTRAGLVLRAVGDCHLSAHSLGYKVLRVRFAAVLFGGACAGLAGSYLSLVYIPQWTEGMTAGRGWIALALVVFASWMPWRVVLGAMLFGAVLILQFHAQAAGVAIPAQFLSSLPYLATIVVLTLIAAYRGKITSSAPRNLGQSFVAER